ncbi:MAG: type II toxin-antitoxin system YafQ family toxin, partial [Candidatus Symbiobacter sp.]|nr:type II toxin-antitoxin system YafQ family toxin [Candidatus Symbiobacter sp.]
MLLIQTFLTKDLPPIIRLLASDIPLDAKYRDHGLKGIWRGYRECHVKPDLLLIYTPFPNDFSFMTPPSCLG